MAAAAEISVAAAGAAIVGNSTNKITPGNGGDFCIAQKTFYSLARVHNCCFNRNVAQKIIPYFKQQTDYTCGPAALRMALGSFGISKTERALSKLLNTKPRVGTPVAAFPQACEKLRLSYCVERDATIDRVSRALKNKFTVIVGYFYEPEQVGHFAVIKKLTKKMIYLLDPEIGPTCAYTVRDFQRMWKRGFSVDPDKNWFMGVKK